MSWAGQASRHDRYVAVDACSLFVNDGLSYAMHACLPASPKDGRVGCWVNRRVWVKGGALLVFRSQEILHRRTRTWTRSGSGQPENNTPRCEPIGRGQDVLDDAYAV